MKSGIAVAFAALFATSAWAQTPAPAASLDLQVPATQNASPASATPADEPGKYYGDVGGNGAAQSDAQVSGSFSTGVGYAKGFGTSFSNAADLNVSKQYGDGNTFNLHIDVSRSTGFPNRRNGYGPGYTGF